MSALLFLLPWNYGRKYDQDNNRFSVLTKDGATEVLRIQDKVTARRAVYHYDRCQVEVQ